jgi:hypothetical protein
MKRPIHLFMLSYDRTYCGIPMMVIAESERKYSLTVDSKKHTCDECSRALGLYMLGKT